MMSEIEKIVTHSFYSSATSTSTSSELYSITRVVVVVVRVVCVPAPQRDRTVCYRKCYATRVPYIDCCHQNASESSP